MTGGGRGIGRAVALRFAEEGARVFINFFVNREAAEKTARDVEIRGGVPHVVQADVKDPAQIARMVDGIRALAGRLDVVVHAAASGVLRQGLELTAKHWDWVLSTNARSFLLACKEASSLMGEGGRVVALTSLGSDRVIPGYAAVGVSKAALEGTCDCCVEALDLFVSIYGAVAGNFALAAVTRGGVYIGGGNAGVLCVERDRATLEGKELDEAGIQRVLDAKWKELQAKYEADKKKDPDLARMPTDEELRALLPVVQERLPTLGAIGDPWAEVSEALKVWGKIYLDYDLLETRSALHSQLFGMARARSVAPLSRRCRTRSCRSSRCSS